MGIETVQREIIITRPNGDGSLSVQADHRSPRPSQALEVNYACTVEPQATILDFAVLIYVFFITVGYAVIRQFSIQIFPLCLHITKAPKTRSQKVSIRASTIQIPWKATKNVSVNTDPVPSLNNPKLNLVSEPKSPICRPPNNYGRTFLTAAAFTWYRVLTCPFPWKQTRSRRALDSWGRPKWPAINLPLVGLSSANSARPPCGNAFLPALN